MKRELKEIYSVDCRNLNEGNNGSVIKLPDGRYRVRAKGQHCNIVNRNRRKYPVESTWGPHTLSDSDFMRRVKSRRVTGQLEHPGSGASSMDQGAVVITDVEPPSVSGEVFIVFETMSTPPGRVVEAYIRDGVGFGLSSRATGSTATDSDGIDVVQPDFEPKTFDCVLDESTPGAEVASQRLRESRQALLESVGGDESKATAKAQEQTEAAVARDMQQQDTPQDAQIVATDPRKSGDLPASGYNEYLLGLKDGAGQYRAYLNAYNQWDVWFEVHNLAPKKIASNMPTIRDAKLAAENHFKYIVGESAAVVDFTGTHIFLECADTVTAEDLSNIIVNENMLSSVTDRFVVVVTHSHNPILATSALNAITEASGLIVNSIGYQLYKSGKAILEHNVPTNFCKALQLTDILNNVMVENMQPQAASFEILDISEDSQEICYDSENHLNVWSHN